MYRLNYYHYNCRNVLATLRKLIPDRSVSFSEALRIAELQACRLLQISDIFDGPVPDDVVLSLPRVERRFHTLRGASGMTYWNGRVWVIGINGSEPTTRQRFTLLHEFKHIIDHDSQARLYTGDRGRTSHRQAELAADYFAGCALIPKRLLRRAWYHGEQNAEALAHHFDVSTKAIQVRLEQIGLLVQGLPVTGSVSRLPPRASRPYFRTSNAATDVFTASGAS